MRLRDLLHALSAVGTMLLEGASLSLSRLGADERALDLEIEASDLEVWPATPTRQVKLARAAHELDALYLASSLHHGVSVSEVGVPIQLGTGSSAEATATESLAVGMLHDWGHFGD